MKCSFYTIDNEENEKFLFETENYDVLPIVGQVMYLNLYGKKELPLFKKAKFAVVRVDWSVALYAENLSDSNAEHFNTAVQIALKKLEL
jgi:hypothetical protein